MFDNAITDAQFLGDLSARDVTVPAGGRIVRTTQRHIVVTHGVVDCHSPSLFVHRNLVDVHAFERHLKSSPPYEPLETVLESGGQALTVDDGTGAAARAALLARTHGHHVTVFVNAENVAYVTPYEFHLLNLVLDHVSCPGSFDGLEQASTDTLRRFRRSFKLRMAQFASSRARHQLVRRLAASVGLRDLDLPEYLRPLSLRDVADLLDAGVHIQNHGWSHTDHSCLSLNAVLTNVQRGKDWLFQVLRITASIFAVPFGDALPPVPSAPSLFRAWLLHTGKDVGIPDVRVLNRTTLAW